MTRLIARPEPVESPLILSLSKDERVRSWFDKLTTSGDE
jgi:hypothetical protein